MEAAEEESQSQSPSPRFWQHHHPCRSSSSSSLFLNPWILLLSAFLLAFLLLFSLSPLFSSLSAILRPNRVKKGWDTLNLFLVFFAILCGILSRVTTTTTDSTTLQHHHHHRFEEENMQLSPPAPSLQQQKQPYQSQLPEWLDQYTNPKMYGDHDPIVNRPLRRNSISYPDLREESPWISRNERWQLSDPDPDPDIRRSDRRHRRRRSYGGEEEIRKGVHVDTVVSRQTDGRNSRAPAENRTFQTVKKVEEAEKIERSQRPPPPPPPPPPPTPPRQQRSEKKIGRSDRKRSGGGAKDIASAFAHLYSPGKKKKHKNKQNYETATHSSPSSSSTPPENLPSPSSDPPLLERTIPHPPPPPPPPPGTLFNLFRKGGKNKKIDPTPDPTPPPPPPPLPPRPERTEKSRRRPPPPPPPPRIGSELPLNPIPPPPPPPPFPMPELKFKIVRDDYVRIASDSSETESTEVPMPGGGGEESSEQPAPSLFCPTPDVNMKADTFIARFKEGWKLEKMNSIKRRTDQRGKETEGGPREHPGAR